MLIASVNFKGGQGKSLWTAILAASLGPDTHVLDLDPKQGDAHRWAGRAGHPSTLVWPKDLAQALKGAATDEDWHIADCPPHEGEETQLALSSASMVVVPVVPGGEQDARAWGRMVEAIKDAQAVNPGLKVAVILNAARGTAISREFEVMLRGWHAPEAGRALLGVVPQRVAISEAYAAGSRVTDDHVIAVLQRFRKFAAQ